MKLFYREEGQGEPLVILHGLFGSSDNWMTLAKKYAQNYRVIVPDARNHGQSPHDKEFSYTQMSNDLAVLIHDLGLDRINLLGHSMGGKIAMKFSATCPEKVIKLMIADISPKQYPVHHERIIETLKSMNLPLIKSRTEADKLMSAQIEAFGERQFLLKNLKRSDSGFAWKMALDYIADNIENVGEGLSQEEIVNIPTMFIRGGESWYIKDEEIAMLEGHFKNFELKTIKEAGHWLHAERPQEFYDITMDFLNK